MPGSYPSNSFQVNQLTAQSQRSLTQGQTLPPCSYSVACYSSRNNTSFFQNKALFPVNRLNMIQIFEMAFRCGDRPHLLQAPWLWLSYSASLGTLQISFFWPKSSLCCRGRQEKADLCGKRSPQAVVGCSHPFQKS